MTAAAINHELQELEAELENVRWRIRYVQDAERFSASTVASPLPSLRRREMQLQILVENARAPKDAVWDLAVQVTRPTISTARAAQMIREFMAAQ